jgi:predicted ATPase
LGEHQLTDLYRPEHIFQLVHPALPTAFPALRTLESRPNNLPLQPTLLIGREREVDAIKTLLARESVRLVTLTGPGGMGKTRLALQVAADLLADLRDGVWFVSLATTVDPQHVAETIAETLGLRSGGGRDIPDLITAFLRKKRLLLVLDNFEQVVDAAPLVNELLATCPGLMVLVTSRVRLQLRGEHEIPVPPLDLPDSKHPTNAELLSQFEAVRLFIERAQDVKPDFLVTNANVPAIAAICHRLDGSPLAIELAAARIRILPPAAMLARLEQRLSLLTGGARDLPERQRTLRGTIAWSYDLLGAHEQALFRQLAIFVGGCSLEAVETVAGRVDGPEHNDNGTLDRLELLVAHNLVRQEEGAGEPWFRMLETIREFGLEQLSAHGELAEANQRHATYYFAFAEEADRGLKGTDSGEWVVRMESEYDNFRAALAWANTQNAVETSLRLRTTLYRFWLTRGHTQR